MIPPAPPTSPMPTLLILGPTAGGKSSLAIELAKRIGGECLSADSMQVYRGMDIGTAKTPLGERAGVPHHLIDLIAPDDDSFSVDRWLELCQKTIAEVRGRNRTPIIVGGTNLYVQTLLMGISDALPAPDEALRARLNAQPLDELRARLQQVDPAAAQRIHFNDRKRTIRAIEVFEQTGRRLSELQRQWNAQSQTQSLRQSPGMAIPGLCIEEQSIFIIGLEHSVEAINRRINARVKAMIEQGLMDEVRTLHAANRLGRNAREALGYKQIVEHLEGRCPLDDAVEQIKIRTRRYAKQQRTWLRRFRTWRPSIWMEVGETSAPASPQIIADQALAAIENWSREPGCV